MVGEGSGGEGGRLPNLDTKIHQASDTSCRRGLRPKLTKVSKVTSRSCIFQALFAQKNLTDEKLKVSASGLQKNEAYRKEVPNRLQCRTYMAKLNMQDINENS